MDTSKGWKPHAGQILGEASKSIDQARDSLNQASEALGELKDAIAHEQEEVLFMTQFIQHLADGKIELANLTELSGVVELDDEQIERLTTIILLLNNKGGKSKNGV
jgi:hypothetical protein